MNYLERKRERYVESIIHRRYRNYQFRDHQGAGRKCGLGADCLKPRQAGDGGSGKRQGLNRRYRQQRDCGKAVGGTAFPRGGGFYRFYTGAGKAGFRLFPGKMRPVFLYRNRVGVSKAVDEPGDYGKHSDEKSLLAVF